MNTSVINRLSFTNFTSILPKPDNVYAFNPTIAHYKDDLYICAFRGFVRYPNLHQVGDSYNYSKDPYSDPNHPWLGGDASSVWWKKSYGDDTTRFCILHITMQEVQSIVRLEKSYENGGATYWDGSSMVDGKMHGNDARILRVSETDPVYLLSYNVWVTDKGTIIRDGKNCTDSCGLIATRVITIAEDMSLVVGDEKILCPSMSNRVEKNWSFWIHNQNIFFSYGLYPVHDVVSVKIKDNIVNCGKNVGAADAVFFQKFTEYYNNKVYVSVTTPAIKINKVYIGIGHIKFKYKNAETEYPANSYLVKFVNDMKKSGKIFHPMYVYLMFFYAFSSKDATVLGVSPMFLPSSNTVLCFPSGFCRMKDPDMYLISYGDADTSCSCFTISEKQLDSILIFSKDLNPRNVPFLMTS